MIFSKTAITVLKAAKDMKTKNSVPHTLPPFIFINTLGSVTKISDGPASGEMEKEKQEGNIISPDTTATKVSKSQILKASEKRVFSLDIYVPNISMAQIPRERVKKAWFIAATTTDSTPFSFSVPIDGTK